MEKHYISLSYREKHGTTATANLTRHDFSLKMSCQAKTVSIREADKRYIIVLKDMHKSTVQEGIICKNNHLCKKSVLYGSFMKKDALLRLIISV